MEPSFRLGTQEYCWKRWTRFNRTTARITEIDSVSLRVVYKRDFIPCSETVRPRVGDIRSGRTARGGWAGRGRQMEPMGPLKRKKRLSRRDTAAVFRYSPVFVVAFRVGYTSFDSPRFEAGQTLGCSGKRALPGPIRPSQIIAGCSESQGIELRYFSRYARTISRFSSWVWNSTVMTQLPLGHM